MDIRLIFLEIARISRGQDRAIFPTPVNDQFGVLVGDVRFAHTIIQNFLQFSYFEGVGMVNLGFGMSNITIMPIRVCADLAHNFEFDVFCTL